MASNENTVEPDTVSTSTSEYRDENQHVAEVPMENRQEESGEPDHSVEIYKAIGEDKLEEAVLSVKRINDADFYGKPPLLYAVQKQNLNMVETLLKHGAKVTSVSPEGYSILFYAVKSGHYDISKRIIEAGADINAVGNDGFSILYHAIDINSVPLVRLLTNPEETVVDKVLHMNYIGFGGVTILYHAVNKGNLEIVELLTEAGSDVNQPCNDHSPLFQAVVNDSIQIVRSLLAKKAKVTNDEIRKLSDEKEKSDSVTELMKSVANDYSVLDTAVEDENLNLIKLLIHQHVNVREADAQHNILFKAVDKENVEIVELLLKNHAIANGHGNSFSKVVPVLYHAAIKKQNAEISNLLVKYNADIYQECFGCTILQHSIKAGNFEVLETLLWSSIDIDKENSVTGRFNIQTMTNGYNALEFALVHGTPEIVQLLILVGARCTPRQNWQRNSTVSYLDYISKISNENLRSALDNSLLMEDSNTVRVNYNTISNCDDVDETLMTLWHISEQEKFRDLLTHPVFTTFNQWKWESLSAYYYINLLFCIVFYLSLIIYQNVFYISREDISWGKGASYGILLIFFLLYITREFTQMYLNFKSYRKDFENGVELSLLFLTFCVLCCFDIFPRDQISAVCNIIMALSLTLMIGHVEYASTAVSMLRTVSLTFFKNFSAFSLIFAIFGLTFYQLFYKTTGEVQQPQLNTNTTNSDERTSTYAIEIVRVFVKFIGELEVSGIEIGKINVVTAFIILYFIFLCPVIMLNLLNGLAVSNILDEENLKIFMQKSRLNYFHNAQMYYKVNFIEKVLILIGMRLKLTGFDHINVCSYKAATKSIDDKQIKVTSDSLPLLNRESNIIIEEVPIQSNRIYNNHIIKDVVNIRNKIELSKSDNLQQKIMAEITAINKKLIQLDERFTRLDEEEETKNKSLKRAEELMHKIYTQLSNTGAISK